MADRLKKMVLVGDDDNAAVRAYASLADRAFGKPVQKNENEDVTPDKGKVFRFHIVQSQEVKK
jgi:hypothetical protein